MVIDVVGDQNQIGRLQFRQIADAPRIDLDHFAAVFQLDTRMDCRCDRRRRWLATSSDALLRLGIDVCFPLRDERAQLPHERRLFDCATIVTFAGIVCEVEEKLGCLDLPRRPADTSTAPRTRALLGVSRSAPMRQNSVRSTVVPSRAAATGRFLPAGSVGGGVTPAAARIDAVRSIVIPTCGDVVPARMRPGHRISSGTRIPPSHSVDLRWKSGALRDSHSPPLSLVKITSVFGRASADRAGRGCGRRLGPRARASRRNRRACRRVDEFAQPRLPSGKIRPLKRPVRGVVRRPRGRKAWRARCSMKASARAVISSVM